MFSTFMQQILNNSITSTIGQVQVLSIVSVLCNETLTGTSAKRQINGRYIKSKSIALKSSFSPRLQCTGEVMASEQIFAPK